jgi:hypothetical protein
MPFLLAVTLATLLPLNDLGPAPYGWGYFGGLWENGSNTIPADHAAAGLQRAALIQPLDADGKPSPDGKIGFIVAGADDASRIAAAFSPMARMRPEVVLVNGAAEGMDGAHWILYRDPNYDRIRNSVLKPAGLTEKQVQAAWIELENDYPYAPLPPQYSDAYLLKSYIAASLRAMKIRWPNLQVAYLSSRVYGGYSTIQRNPEPYAYESALSVRWVVLGQVDTMRNGGYLWDSRIGDVDYERGSVPWISWGPYFWANGTTPRSDGLTWTRDDFASDGESLSDSGAQKAAAMLLSFLMSEPTAQWFRAAELPPRIRPIRAP